MPNPSPTRDAIEQFLRKAGPSTLAQIALATKKPADSVKRCIMANREGSYRRFYIVDYAEKIHGSGYTRPARWAVGTEPDAPYPNIDRKAGHRQAQKRYLERKKRQALIAQNHNPFASLIAQIVKDNQ